MTFWAMVSAAAAQEFRSEALQELATNAVNEWAAAQALALPAPEGWVVTGRDQTSTTFEFYLPITNSQTRDITMELRRVIAVGNGLNYQDAGGNWRSSENLIELAEDGTAQAKYGPTKVILQPNVNSYGAVSITTPHNSIVRTHILGLYYFDPVSGKRARLSKVCDSIAELHRPNQIVWRSALESLDADIRFTYTSGAIELDVIFHKIPPSPELFGFGPDTRIELWHEFVSEERPTVKSRVARSDANPSRELIDETLDFCGLWFPTGRAFMESEVSGQNPTPAREVVLDPDNSGMTNIAIAKAWKSLNGRNFLVESVLWQDACSAASRLGISDQPTSLTEVAPEGQPIPQRSSTLDKVQIAQASYCCDGLVWDWIGVSGGTDITFLGSSYGTYWVTNNASFSGLMTFNSGCIVKFKPGKWLMTYGDLQCSSTGSPSILTADWDNRFGENILGSTCGTNFCASVALWDYYICRSLAVSNMRICFAYTPIQFDNPGGGGCDPYLTHLIQNSSIEHSRVTAYGAFTVQNSQAIDVDTCYGTFTQKTSLAKHIRNSTIALSSVSGDTMLLNLSGGYPVGYNQNCWIYGKQGYTSEAVSNSTSAWWDPPCTLITPRHGLLVRHRAYYWELPYRTNEVPAVIGTQFRFIGSDGSHHVVTCVEEERVGEFYDMAVLLFSDELPSTVHRARALPASAANKLWFFPSPVYNCTNTSLPVIGMNSCVYIPTSRYARTMDLWSSGSGVLYLQTPSQWVSSKGCGVVQGDSGNPIYALINDELVLAAHWSSTGSGAWYGSVPDDVNAAILAVDMRWFHSSSGYSLSLAPLSDFPDE